MILTGNGKIVFSTKQTKIALQSCLWSILKSQKFNAKTGNTFRRLASFKSGLCLKVGFESIVCGLGVGLGPDNFRWTWIFCYFGSYDCQLK